MKPAPPVISVREGATLASARYMRERNAANRMDGRGVMLTGLVSRLMRAVPDGLIAAIRRRPRISAVADRVASRVLRSQHGSMVTIAEGPARGLSIRLPERSSIWITGRVEREVQDAFVELVKPGGVVYDVGSSLGFFTLLAARLVGPEGMVIAIEPHPANAEGLAANVAANDLGNVTIVREAASGSTGRAFFDASSTTLGRVLESGEDESALEVGTVTIDDLVARTGAEPDVVKIDVEGHEVEVLEGMSRCLENVRPVLICEMHGRNVEVADLLDRVGYYYEVIDHDRHLRDAPPWVHVVARRESR
jgi:FkbM family methyltransferase